MRRLATPTLSLAALVLAATSLAAQSSRRSQSDAEWLEQCRSRGDYGNRWDARACEVRAVSVRRDVRSLTLDGASNGGVSVTGWDRDSVHVSARMQSYSTSQAEAERSLRDIRIASEGGTIRARGPSGENDRQRWSVSYDVYVPRRMDLDLRAHNGGLRVEGVTGRMTLEAHNGGIALRGAGGDVRAHAQNGGLSIQLTGTRWEGTGLDAQTQNGGVRLVIPERYSARLETGTVNGSIRTDFPITVSGRISRHFSLTLGSGGAPVRATTTNGGVIIERE
jgi:DUF4097 and DUF4098 domain-containing protein YvlB